MGMPITRFKELVRDVRKREKKIIDQELQEGKTYSKRGTIVVYESDFKNKEIWKGLLETFGIPSGEEANWNEPDELELTIVKVKVL